MSNFQAAKFDNTVEKEFLTTLRKRVMGYFKENNKSKEANANMVFKSIFMVTLFTTPYVLMIAGFIQNPWMVFFMYVLMGFGMTGIGLCIMHDANHGAYSKNPKVNKYMGLLLNYVGGNALNWKIQHNMLHHSYTNVDGLDEDINPGAVMRFSPHQPRLKHHKYQHVYAWVLYSLMTLSWLMVKDFKQLKRYHKMGLAEPASQKSFKRVMLELTFSKVIYWGLIVLLPMFLLPVSWWVVALGVIVMNLIAGLILAMIFQPAHVMPESAYPLPDQSGKIDNNWAIHQLMTTQNFASKKRIFSWLVGGLNFQVEHHLFPNICHVHYSKIAPIVEATAKEYGIPYYSRETFREALIYHGKMLKMLGQTDMAQ